MKRSDGGDRNAPAAILAIRLHWRFRATRGELTRRAERRSQLGIESW